MTITAPTDAPVLTAVPDSFGCDTGTYYFAYSYSDGTEESELSPVEDITINSASHIDISALTPLPDGVTKVNLYMSEALNSSTLRFSCSYDGEDISIWGFRWSPKASSKNFGTVKLSVDPVNSDNPIAVGDNDPRLSGGGGGDPYTLVSQGASISADSTSSGNVASNANDGDTTTTRWVSGDTAPHYLVIDLTTEVSIGKWKVYHAPGAPDYNTKDFKLQSSPDNSTWADRDTVTSNTEEVTERTFTSVNARYWRLYISAPNQNQGGAAGDTHARIQEFQLYRDNAVTYTIGGLTITNSPVVGYFLGVTSPTTAAWQAI